MADRDAVILGYVRTPIGRYGGVLSHIRPDDLAAHVIVRVLDRSGVKATEVDEVVFGAANQAGEDNRNVGRMAALLAGLPNETPGVTVNRLCGSGLEAVNDAARRIRQGDAEVVVAGGVESMSRAPWVMLKPSEAFALSKEGLNAAWDRDFGSFLETEAGLQDRAGRTHDYAEGVRAFLGKRAARFEGR